MIKYFLAFLFFTSSSYSQISSETLDVNVIGGAISLTGPTSVTVSNLPATQPVSQSGVWTIDSITDPLTISGTVSVSGPLTDVQLRASAVPVSLVSVPTHPVTQSGVWSVGLTGTPTFQATDLDIRNLLFSTDKVDVSGSTVTTGGLTNTELRASAVAVSLASVPTHPVTQSGAFTVGVNNFPTVQPVNDNGGSLTVDGSVGITGSVAVTGPLTDSQLRATPVPVSGTISTGGLTDAQLRASAVPVSLTSTTISNFPATQAISAASLPLPAGAATETTAAAINTKTPALGQALMAASTPVVIASNQSALPVTGTFFQATQPISGTVSVSNFPATQPVSGTVNIGTGAFVDRTTAAAPYANRLSDGAAFYDARSIRALTSADIVTVANPQTSVSITGTPTVTVGNASLAVTGSFFQATQPISAAALPLPSGASTLLEQQAQTTALQLIDNLIGPVNAGTAATNSQLTGGVFNTTLPTLTTGQQVATQLDAKGRPLRATTNGRFSYVASTPIAGLAVGATASQDIFRISGSATKAVYIKKIRVSVTATAAQGNNIHLIKRSAANTGGTSTALVLVPSDSSYAASTSSVLQYTVAPTSGAAVGPVRSAKYLIPTATGLYNSEMVFEFGENDGEPLVLRGVAQGLGIVFGTAPGAGANANITVVWEEEN